MKILILSHSFYPALGGIEIITESLAKEFSKFGHVIKVLTWTDGNDNFPFEVIRNPNIYEIIANHRWSDLVFESNPSLKLSWPLLLTRKKHIVVLHTWINDVNGKSNFQTKLKKRWLKRADKVVAVSQVVKEDVFSSSLVIHNSYDDSIYTNYNQKRILDFVFLGRLVSDKGVDMGVELIRALKEKHHRNCSLTIIGDGDECNKLNSLIKNYNLENQVKLVGPKRGVEIAKILNQHKFLLVTSRWKEPFGIVALEGMACGCIPIVSDESGLVDAIGNAGITFERNNLESLIQVTTHLLNDQELQNHLVKKAQDHLRNHTSKTIALKYLDVMEKL